MSTLILEHVPVTELPAEWQAQLQSRPAARVTIRIDEEAESAVSLLTDNPLFGMWSDRHDIEDVNAHARQMREPRFKSDGSRTDD